MTFACAGRNSLANVVFPAPLGPAITMQRGAFFLALVFARRELSRPSTNDWIWVTNSQSMVAEPCKKRFQSVLSSRVCRGRAFGSERRLSGRNCNSQVPRVAQITQETLKMEAAGIELRPAVDSRQLIEF